MMLKKRCLFSIRLLILVLVAYTLIIQGNAAFALESNKHNSTATLEASADVDKKDITIGDKIRFIVRVRHKDGVSVQFPELNQHLGVFTVNKSGIAKSPVQERDGYSVIEQDYVLSSYKTGRQTIPSLKIKYKDAHGEGEIITNEVTVDIKGIVKEGESVTDIKDIFPPVNVAVSYNRLAKWALMGIGALLLTGVGYMLVNRLKKRPKEQKQAFRKRPPHEVAFELLERLLSEDLINKGLFKEYYYRITDILRHYIEDRFGLSAPESTTEEFLIEMAHTNKLNNKHKLLIREFLEHCDMVKYAKYGPSRKEAKETYDIAKRLVGETKECFEEMEVVAR